MFDPHAAYSGELERVQQVIARLAGDGDRFAETLRQEQIAHLSYSQVTAVEFCPRRYYLQYVRQVELTPVPAYFAKGKLIHNIIAETYICLNASQSVDRDAYFQRIGQAFDGEQRVHLENAVALHLENLWHGCRVVGIEQPFAFAVSDAMPPIVGVIDLILEKDGQFIVIDHKTGHDFYPQDELQMAIYREYIRRAYGAVDPQFYYESYRWVNNLKRIRKPAFHRHPVNLQYTDWQVAENRLKAASRQIEAIRRAHSGSKTGICFRCPYFRQC